MINGPASDGVGYNYEPDDWVPEGWDNPEEDDGSTEHAQAVRDRVVSRQQTSALAPRAPRVFDTAVVGVSFVDTYPGNMYALERLATEKLWREVEDPEPIPVVLIRNPGNEHDTNAIQVHVPALGDDGFIGLFPRALSARMVAVLDAGARYAAAVTSVRISPDHPDRPGIDIHCELVVEDD